MVIIFFRVIIIMLLLIFVMRLMGKRQIGEMQPYEFIITLLIAEVACVPMSDVSIPLMYGISSILAIFIMHQILSMLEHAGFFAKNLVNGKPSVIIDTRGVNVNELNKNNLDVQDLIESLRATGNFSLQNIKYAILESNGKLSVLPKKDSNDDDFPILLISKGKILLKNFKNTGLKLDYIKNVLRENNYKHLKNVEVLTISNSGKCYLKLKNEKFKLLKVPIPQSIKW